MFTIANFRCGSLCKSLHSDPDWPFKPALVQWPESEWSSRPGHPSSTLFACQTHNRGISRNENKELARSQKFVVVTRLA